MLNDMKKIKQGIQNTIHLFHLFVICSHLSISFMQCLQMSTFQLIQMTSIIIQKKQLTQTSLTTHLETESNQLLKITQQSGNS